MPKYRVRKGKWLIISSIHILSSRWQDGAHLLVTETFGGKLYLGASEGRFLDEEMTKVLLHGFMLAKPYDFLCYCKYIVVR